jgi:hypothetical protein
MFFRRRGIGFLHASRDLQGIYGAATAMASRRGPEETADGTGSLDFLIAATDVELVADVGERQR